MRLRSYLLLLGIGFLFLFGGGVLIYHALEGWSYLDAAYFTIVTITTVGYGDITPLTNAGKIVTIAYSLVGTIVLFHIISIVSHRIVIKKYLTK